jgi:uroporphyrin-3 C-methyltransferase/uroporphyrinogen III methyltransferase/synthase
MNELPSSSDTGQAAGEPSRPLPDTAVSPAPAARGGAAARGAIYVGLLLLALLLAAEWWNTQREIGSLREEVAQRLHSGETAGTETRALVKSVQDNMKEIQSKVSVLESKQVEAQGQQVALEQLYQELSRNRDDWALSEIEQILSAASEQLQLAGNVHGALIALQYAESQLSRSDKPQFISIRRAVARDMEKLKALPQVDLTAIALRLDSAIGQIDEMPLLSDEKPVEPPSPPRQRRRVTHRANAAAPTAPADSRPAWLARLQNAWIDWSSDFWSDVRQLIRVRKVDTPDALMMSPTQAYFVRENLKLRLLNARLALLTHNDAAFRSDIAAAQDAISRYFDTRARQTQTVQTLLRQVQNSNLSIEMPTLADSLNAVRNYKAKP